MLPLLLALIAFITPQSAFAESTMANTITVAPSIIKIDLTTDTPGADIFYTNTTSSIVQLSFSSRDFSGLEDNGQIDFLNQTDAQNYHYALSSWIHFATNSLTLNPGEKKSVHITIEKEALPVGGH